MSAEANTSELLAQNFTSASREIAEEQSEDIWEPQPCLSPLVSPPGPGERWRKRTSPTSSSQMSIDYPKVRPASAKALVAAIAIAFLIVAINTITRTKMHPAVVGLLHSDQQNISEDGSSNLNMSWLGGEALNFRTISVFNVTMDLNEPRPGAWRFLLDWSAEAVGLGASVEICD